MFIKNIIALVNTELAGEMLNYADLRPFLDHTIDDINAQLNTTYPVFSDLASYDVDYNVFPEQYIRGVVVPGAAWYYYVMDEEGAATAQQYQSDYTRGLTIMQRDMLYNIPEQYQADSLQGSVQYSTDVPGIELNFGLGVW